jgi:hypothetical protein
VLMNSRSWDGTSTPKLAGRYGERVVYFEVTILLYDFDIGLGQ